MEEGVHTWPGFLLLVHGIGGGHYSFFLQRGKGGGVGFLAGRGDGRGGEGKGAAVGLVLARIRGPGCWWL